MIAGTLGLLEDTVSEPLEDYATGGFRTLDVRETQSYLDGGKVQQGRAAGRVESTQEEIYVDGGTVDVERVGTINQVWTEWVADVTDAGFVAAERTAGTDPTFPFDLFSSRVNSPVRPAEVDTGSFVQAQREEDSLQDVWMSMSKTATESNIDPDDVDVGYGREATPAGGNVGVGFRISWDGTIAKGIVYASGYLACYNESWGPLQFSRFVRERVLPHAYIPEPEDDGEQTTLGGDA